MDFGRSTGRAAHCRWSRGLLTLLLVSTARSEEVPVGPNEPPRAGAVFSARDSLRLVEETSVDARECLDGLVWSPEDFTVRLEPPAEGRGDHTVRFPSPRPTGVAAVDDVAIEWHAARDATGLCTAAPGCVVVHESGSGMQFGRMFAAGLAARGIHGFLLHLPHYGLRRSPGGKPDAAALVMAVRQAVADVRRARDAVAVLPTVEADRIGLEGTSLGGFVAATAAALDRGFDRVFIVLAGGDILGVIDNGSGDATKLRQRVAAAGMSDQQLRDALHAVEPLRTAHRLDPRQTWLYSALYDDVVPPRHATAFAEAIGLPADHHLQLHANHYSGIVYLPLVLAQIRGHLLAEPTAAVPTADPSPEEPPPADAVNGERPPESASTGAVRGGPRPPEDPPAAPAPSVLEPPDDLPALAAGFALPDGFTAELFAAEPMVANPIALSVDRRGAVFVAESFSTDKFSWRFGVDAAAWTEADLATVTIDQRLANHRRFLGDRAAEWHQRSEQVRRLEDTDGDGRADRSTVFAAGFNGLLDGHASGVLALDDAVLLASIPAIWRLVDRDGDGVADERDPVHVGYGVREGLRGHDLHALVLGPDGRVYFSIGDRGFHVEQEGRLLADAETGAVFRCERDGSWLEVVATGLRNPQGLAFDDLGNLFTVDNNADFGDLARLVQVVPGGDSGWRLSLHYFPDRGPFGRERLWHLPHDGQPAWIVPPLAHLSVGPAGLETYPGTGLTPHFSGRFLLADFCWEPAKSSIRSFRVRPAGAAFEACDEEATFRNVLATDVKVGVDGAVWVANWVAPEAAGARGRIWRFVPKADDVESGERERMVAEVRELLARDWSQHEGDALTALLGHADRRVRLEAQWELARRGDTARLTSVLAGPWPPVDQLLERAAVARRHAVWGLEQTVRHRDPEARAAAAESIAGLMNDPEWETRLVACRCLGELAVPATREPLLKALDDPQPHVRAAAAFGLGRLAETTGDQTATAAAIVARLRREAADGPLDPHLRHALVMGLTGSLDAAGRRQLAGDDDPEIRLVACLVMRRRADPHLAALLDDPDTRLVLEAARAIHDVPVPAALPALVARLVEGPALGDEGDALVRRAISAAERIGTPEAAEALVACAARTDVSTARREEALAVLAAWGDPPARDRVIGRFWPAATRTAESARPAVARALPDLLAAAETTVLVSPAPDGEPVVADIPAAVLTTAAALGVADLGPLLAAAVTDDTRAPTTRSAALAALAKLDNEAAETLAEQVAADAAAAVRMVARRLRVTRGPPDAVAPELVRVVCELAPDTAAAESQHALDLLAAIDHPLAADALATISGMLAEDRLDPRLELEALEAIERRLGSDVAARLRTARESLPRFADVPEGWHDTAVGGDAARGRRLFFDDTTVGCVRCHRAEGRGGVVGPKLDGLTDGRSRGHLVESIVHPSARFTDGYVTAVIATDDGRAFTGVVVEEDAEVMTLAAADGTLHRIPLTAIEHRGSAASAMPADLATMLSRRGLRDLVEWLTTLGTTEKP
jgi:quinoprotein glucose dehydrogenase